MVTLRMCSGVLNICVIGQKYVSREPRLYVMYLKFWELVDPFGLYRS